MVSPRVGAKRLEARGIFPKAEVVRGHNWRFEDQDGRDSYVHVFQCVHCEIHFIIGGVGKIGTVEAIEGYQDKTAVSTAS